VAKKSSGKMSLGGRKEAYRLLNEENKAFGEQLVTREHPLATSAHYARKLQHLVMQSGELTENPDAQTIQKRHTLWRNEMPDESLQVSNGTAAFTAKAPENPVEHPTETKRHSSMEGVNR
jgi:nicotinate phosphoribosyltransferase